MVDSEDYYDRLAKRATVLHQQTDEAVHALMRVEDAVAEVSKGDLEVADALRIDEHADLHRCMEQAMFFVRAIERITLAHRTDANGCLCLSRTPRPLRRTCRT